jgi:hypothetical protein
VPAPENNENRDGIPEAPRSTARNNSLDQSVRSEFAVPINNEIGITEQRIPHSPEGAETTNSRKG